MTKYNIYDIYRNAKENYGLKLLSYSPITSKSIKVETNNNEKYIIKKTKSKVMNKYHFLKNEGIDNIIYPILNHNNLSLTRLSENEFCDECYYVLPYYKENYVLNETKVKSLLEELEKLHRQTGFYRKLSIIKSRNKMDEIISFLNYQYSIIEAYIKTIESQKYDEFSIPILKNYQYILKTKNIMINKNKAIIKAIKEEKSVFFCFLHNNPKIDHLIIIDGKKYLISIDNGVIGIPSLDIAKFYIENQDIYYDISSQIKEYLNSYDDEFYYDYFIFMVILIYLKGLIINTKEYTSTQSFIYTSNSIKKFIKNFNLE